jgi:hypothetical protein
VRLRAHVVGRRRRGRRGFYYSSKKDLDRSRMRNANKEFKFRGPSKLLDFGNADVVDIASVSDGVLQDVQEEDEVMITTVNIAACATEVIVGLTPA